MVAFETVKHPQHEEDDITMGSISEDTGTGTPSTNGAVTPKLDSPDYDTIRVLRPGERIEDVHLEPNIAPPKLKIKLRNLASKPPTSLDMHTSSAAISTSAETDHPGGKVNNLLKTSAEHEASLQWVTTTPSTSNGTQTSSLKPVTATGTANDPIDVDILKRSSPHRFLQHEVGYFAPIPLQYRPSRPKLAPSLVTPNGATILSGKVSGHESHDIYKILAARKRVPTPPGFERAQPQLLAPATLPTKVYAPGKTTHALSSTQFGNVHSQIQQNLSPAPPRRYSCYPYTTPYMTPTNGYPIFPLQDEDRLRKRAVQLVLDHSRPRPRKRRLSDDPDETSGSEYEVVPRKRRASLKASRAHTPSTVTPVSSTPSTPSTGVSEEIMFDRNLRLTEMVEHTQLLTSLLMAYPYSTDQEGLRDDIAMLASVSNKRCDSWLSDEADYAQKQRRLSSPTTPSPSPNGSAVTEISGVKGRHVPGKSEVIVLTEELARQQREGQAKRERKDEIRRFLSADSSMWKHPEKKTDPSNLSGAQEVSRMLISVAEHFGSIQEQAFQREESSSSAVTSDSVDQPELFHDGVPVVD